MIPGFEEIGILAAQFNHFFEVGAEKFKVVVGLGFFPHTLAGGGFFGKFSNPLC